MRYRPRSAAPACGSPRTVPGRDDLRRGRGGGAHRRSAAGSSTRTPRRAATSIDTANNYRERQPARRSSASCSGPARPVRAGDEVHGVTRRRRPERRRQPPQEPEVSLETSLRRLRTDHLDVYWVHIWDRHTPIEETMRALDDAVRAGKVLYVGISDAPGLGRVPGQHARAVARLDPVRRPAGALQPAATATSNANCCRWRRP